MTESYIYFHTAHSLHFLNSQDTRRPVVKGRRPSSPVQANSPVQPLFRHLEIARSQEVMRTTDFWLGNDPFRSTRGIEQGNGGRLGGKVPCLPEGALTLVHPENTEVEAQAERFYRFTILWQKLPWKDADWRHELLYPFPPEIPQRRH